MVPAAGLEPARPLSLRILSPLCLPFHHAGKGLTHLALGQPELAGIEFRKEMALNPFAAERDLIPNLGTDL